MRTVVIEVMGLVPELLFGNETLGGAAALLERAAYGLLDEQLPLDPWLHRAVFRNGADAGTLGRYGLVDRLDRSTTVIGIPEAPPNRLAEALGGRGARTIESPDADDARGDPVILVAELAAALEETKDFLIEDRGDLVHLRDQGLAQLQALHPAFMDDDDDALAAVLEGYAALDAGIATLARIMREDDRLLLVSSTGVQLSQGVFRLNDWLRREGYLVLKSEPAVDTKLEGAGVDWSASRAVALGWPDGRIYLNVAGRDGQGIVPAAEAAALRAEIAGKLERLVDDEGTPIQGQVTRPEEAFDDLAGVAPDLLVAVEEHSIVVDDGIGPADGAIFRTHDPCLSASASGSFLLLAPGSILEGEIPAARLQDLLPTLCDLAGVAAPAGVSGRSLLDGLTGEGGRDRSADEEAAQRRLRGLGYL
ncbi:MAG: alkaline phosphatase family protein [Planctomycetes bacterium]|nr:alkaline phosphatase family protein [Planctomycetota bacterium]